MAYGPSWYGIQNGTIEAVSCNFFPIVEQNVAFQADEGVKMEILKSLRESGTDQIFRLLSDSDVIVVIKTLGLLRNLLATPPHIDHIMDLYGTEIMQVNSG